MKTIGQFAKDHEVTVKTLHYYEKVELVFPTKVDPDTGYRYYTDKDSLDLRIVLFMKELGFSLSEIKDIMADTFDKESLLEFLLFKKTQSEKELEHTSKRLFKIGEMIQVIKQEKSKKLNLKELIGLTEQKLFTGPYGRGSLMEELQQAFNKAKEEDTPLCIIQMDLDMFHQLNQTYGYEAGDVVLRRTADEIQNTLSKSKFDAFMDRKGGDEFSVIVKATKEEAIDLANKIVARVNDVDYTDLADDLKASITAGVAAICESMTSYTALMHEASIKLYEAKRNRKE